MRPSLLRDNGSSVRVNRASAARAVDLCDGRRTLRSDDDCVDLNWPIGGAGILPISKRRAGAREGVLARVDGHRDPTTRTNSSRAPSPDGIGRDDRACHGRPGASARYAARHAQIHVHGGDRRIAALTDDAPARSQRRGLHRQRTSISRLDESHTLPIVRRSEHEPVIRRRGRAARARRRRLGDMTISPTDDLPGIGRVPERCNRNAAVAARTGLA